MAARESESVGLVETRIVRIPLPPGGFELEGGGRLPELQVAYETYGPLAPDGGNVVYICHALSGDAHVAGRHALEDNRPGWWDDMVGPGKGIDTRRFHVVCSNNLGGCKGTTGPSSVNPLTGRPYGSAFPNITVGDIVRVQWLLLQHLGIRRLAAVVGGSLGGMQVLEWGIRYPEVVDRCICIASAASLSAQALAFDVVGRKVIMSDPRWAGGDYYEAPEGPHDGLAQARMLGHITYLSPQMMDSKFGREKRDVSEPPQRFATHFQVESYLSHQGEKFVDRFDANSYLHITEAMDAYDLAEAHGSIENAFRGVTARMLVVALSSDWLFPPEQSLAIATALIGNRKRISYCLLDTPHGHDAFLVDIAHLPELLDTFLRAPAAPPLPDGAEAAPLPAGTPVDHRLIAEMIRPGARVLDLGCGDGSLLAVLMSRCGATGLGVDIDLNELLAAIAKGIDVFQRDIDQGLQMIADQSYDYVVLSETLQVVRKPRLVLKEMLRVAREGIVSFPNFGNWRNRLALALKGRMPKSSVLPYEWYETPNIHLATLRDFVALCREDGIRVAGMVPIAQSAASRLLIRLGLWNLGADRVLVRIARGTDAEGR